MARSLSFEVYYIQHGRWQIHARYSQEQRDEAIEEAKRLDTGAFEAACVVREAFDTETNSSSESVIYHTPTMKAKPPVSFITAGSTDAGAQKAAVGTGKGPAPPPGSAAANAKAEAKKRVAEANKERAAKLAAAKQKQPTKPLARPPGAKGTREIDTVDLMVRIAIAFLVASAVGTALGALMIYGLQGLASVGVAFQKTISQLLVIGGWVLGWGVTFFPMLKAALRRARVASAADAPARHKQAEHGPRKPDGAREAAGALAAAADALNETGKQGPADDDRTSEDPDVELDSLARELAETLDDVEPPDDDPEDDAPDLDIAEIDEEDTPAEDAETSSSDPESEPESELEPEPEPEPEPQPEAPAVAETGPSAVKSALDRLVTEAQRLFGRLLQQDSYLRFGMILFIAGAAETFARRAGVAQKQLVDLLSVEIKELGASEAHARGFAANIDEYLLDQRYFDMYSAGRASALRMDKSDEVDIAGLEEAVGKWRQPVAAEQSAQGPAAGGQPESKHFDQTPSKKNGGEDTPHGFVAVLFTDIVNSTNLQQSRGDQWMMNVVRAHNDVVRQALQRFRGNEIKHTGDGIMASFPDAVDGTKAALVMQEGFARFGEMMPDLAFEVRIGLSAGEPIHESGDIFGTPVNLAARVMSKAKAGEVAVSANIRELCKDQAMRFQELGRFTLKGFPEPQPIYRVVSGRKASKTARSAGEIAAAGSR